MPGTRINQISAASPASANPVRARKTQKTNKQSSDATAPSPPNGEATFRSPRPSSAHPERRPGLVEGALEGRADPLDAFHPVIQTWFRRRFGSPTDAQAAGWPLIQSGRDVLIAAPTGSGKTLAAFLCGINALLKQRGPGTGNQEPGSDPEPSSGSVLAPGSRTLVPGRDRRAVTTILYVSPLKALGNDIQRNLETPLAELADVARELGVEMPQIRTAVRTGDTPQKDRQAFVRVPPDILITTPESLYLMLTASRARETLRHVRTVIVDEIHALARDKRGSHLTLSLARLDHVCETRPARIGLSATQKPVEEIAAFLLGKQQATSNKQQGSAAWSESGLVAGSLLPVAGEGSPGGVAILDLGHQRDIELHIEVPPSDLEAVAPKEQWSDVYDRLAGLIKAHRTTLVFVNTRRLSERVAHNLRERLGGNAEVTEADPDADSPFSEAGAVMSHHGSMSRDRRLRVEQRLKAGDLKALVCTASLELGIDIGSIDLVCQIGSPRGVATFLQRVGRSGHALGLRPQGRLFPTSRDELVECAALIRAVKAGRLDRIDQPVAPLDILAQQIVAECACEDWSEDAMFDLVRKAWPYRDLSRDDFDDVIEMLAEGVGDGPGASPPLIHHDRINHVLRGRRNARMASILNGGAIPEMADYRVVAEPDDTVVGTVNEDWAIESMQGDIFLLGSHSWRIRRVAAGEVRVEDAQGAPPTIPFWIGEAPGRSLELSQEVGRLRRDIVAKLDDPDHLREQLKAETGLDDLGCIQVIEYLQASRDALGVIPSDTDVVFERFFDETGGMQLVVHAPFGARINKAWGLTLRKRFCVRFDFELQAAASDDSIVLSLGPQHSFPLEDAFDYVTPANAEQSLRQAVLYAPVFPVRWRWDAGRALAVPRYTGARKVPPPIQRMRADDLLAAVFPAQVACQENATAGPIEVPDHPLVRQTIHDCLHEAMDLDGLVSVLQQIKTGEVRLHAIDTLEPSPMAHEILNGKPYTYLDDAPLEERRTRAITLRRSLPESSRELGTLDLDAIERVRDEAWPAPRDAEEVHDALLSLVAVPEEDAEAWQPWLEELVQSGRAGKLVVRQAHHERTKNDAQLNDESSSLAVRPEPVEGRDLVFAAENLRLIEALYPAASVSLTRTPPENALVRIEDRDEARQRLLRGWTEAAGPITAAGLGLRLGLTEQDLDYGLRGLESKGFVLRGAFTPRGENVPTTQALPDEYCDRRLLARIHRYTLDRLRREIDPVSSQEYMRFLLRWQHLAPDSKLAGKAGVRQAVLRLQGFEAAAAGWERELLAARVSDYRPSWLDELCLAGEVVWARLTPRKSTNPGAVPSRATPLTVALRRDFPSLLEAARGSDAAVAGPKTGAAAEILELLQRRGALFFDEIVNGTRRLRSDVERGLRELVAWGAVTADGFQGLRQLLGRGGSAGRRGTNYAPGGFFTGSGPAGRWTLVSYGGAPTADPDTDELSEGIANVLLQRYGVVFRDLYPREAFALPWRDVLRALRRLEARGLVRGGRFVSGFNGEQYALPDAVDALRRVRRTERTGERVWVSAVDPVNLAGVVVPGTKVPAMPGRGVLFVDGLPQTEAAPTPEKPSSKRSWRLPARV